MGASWGTGSDLAGSLGSVIPTSGLYAPTFYLGEMYLQQKLLQQKLTILAGRLSAANTFAALPVFANYVNYGINPNPFSLGANDVTFFSPPAGTEWGGAGFVRGYAHDPGYGRRVQHECEFGKRREPRC